MKSLPQATRNESFLPLIQAVIGGLLAGSSLEQGGILLMAPALAILWAISKNCLAAGLWGFAAVLISHRWLLALHPLTWIGIPASLSLFIAIFIWLICCSIGSILTWTWAKIGKLIRKFADADEEFQTELFYSLVMACLWGFGEVVLSKSPIYWIGIETSFLKGNFPLVGLARWIGSGGLATLEIFMGWWLLQTILIFGKKQLWRKTFSLGVLSLLLANGLGLILLQPPPISSSAQVALWQPAIATRTKFSEEQKSRLPKIIQTTLQKASDLNADWLVAPEGTLPPNQKLLAPAQITFLTGGFRWTRGQQRSSLLVFDEGNLVSSSAIDKHRLVPLGEWVPSLGNIRLPGLSAIGGLDSGPPSRLLNWSGPPVAVAICYELSNGSSIAQAVSNGAEWVLAIGNLDPYPLLLQKQFLDLAKLRSIEVARDLISVGNTGPSSLVSSSGEISNLIPPFESKIGSTKINLHQDSTGYIRWREKPLLAIMFASLYGLMKLKIRKIFNL